jgi:poly(A) polymerase
MQHTDPVIKTCQDRRITFLFDSISALDTYFGLNEKNTWYLLTDANLVSLARIFEDIEFPGLPTVDAGLRRLHKRYYFRCVDSLTFPPPRFYTAQNFYFDPRTGRYLDRGNAYRDLRKRILVPRNGAHAGWQQVMDAAHLVARYGFTPDPGEITPEGVGPKPPLAAQRRLLSNILCGAFPGRGLEILKACGFISRFWPELTAMMDVPQDKDFHPEGNVWEHALACLEHRKEPDLLLSLALLLHDIGKTTARGDRFRPFHNHTELGAALSSGFLGRLGFDRELIRDVTFLVRQHMMPAAMHRMPLYRIEKLLRSPLFPHLLELYRADIESSFRKPDGYYEACRIYRSFLKIENNPYRSFKLSKRIFAQ